MTCLVTERISAPCNDGHPIKGDVHVVGDVKVERGLKSHTTGFYCKDHCPIHCQLPIEWDRPPAPTTEGTQGGLF